MPQQREFEIATAVLGTANLFGLVGHERSRAVLRAALDAGFDTFDTAPSYGHGRTEAELGEVLAGREGVRITTKVGLEAAPVPPPTVRLAKYVARHLPRAVQDRLRPVSRPAAGRFAPAAVRASVERSLRRLGRVDLLLLHEVAPDELSEGLLDQLDHLCRSGDVGGVGVATQNGLTELCLARSPALFASANVSVAPHEALPHVPGVSLVGHGALGRGAAVLGRLRSRLRTDAQAAESWDEVTSGTPWGSADGLALALLGRAAASGVRGVIVTTSRPERLPTSREAVESGAAVPAGVQALLDGLLDGLLADGAVA